MWSRCQAALHRVANAPPALLAWQACSGAAKTPGSGTKQNVAGGR